MSNRKLFNSLFDDLVGLADYVDHHSLDSSHMTSCLVIAGRMAQTIQIMREVRVLDDDKPERTLEEVIKEAKEKGYVFTVRKRVEDGGWKAVLNLRGEEFTSAKVDALRPCQVQIKDTKGCYVTSWAVFDEAPTVG